MIRMLQKNPGALQDYWYVSCPHCCKELSWVAISPVYCSGCGIELPPWYLLLEDDVADDICIRIEYHFSGDL